MGEAFSEWINQEAKIAVRHRHSVLAAMNGSTQQTETEKSVSTLKTGELR